MMFSLLRLLIVLYSPFFRTLAPAPCLCHDAKMIPTNLFDLLISVLGSEPNHPLLIRVQEATEERKDGVGKAGK